MYLFARNNSSVTPEALYFFEKITFYCLIWLLTKQNLETYEDYCNCNSLLSFDYSVVCFYHRPKAKMASFKLFFSSYSK